MNTKVSGVEPQWDVLEKERVTFSITVCFFFYIKTVNVLNSLNPVQDIYFYHNLLKKYNNSNRVSTLYHLKNIQNVFRF